MFNNTTETRLLGSTKQTRTQFPTFGRFGKFLWRGTKIAGRGLLILAIIALVGHIALNIYASLLLNRELSSIRQKGEPLTLPELVPPVVPDSKNAALVYAKAFAAYNLTDQEETEVARILPQTETPNHREVERILVKNQSTIDLARQAASMPQCRFPVNWNATPGQLDFPHYARLRNLARLMTAKAWIEAGKGDMAAALRDVAVIYGLSYHAHSDLTLISYLVAKAIDSIANRTLAIVLEKIPLDREDAHHFLTSYQATDWNAVFQYCLQNERAIGIWAFESMRTNPQGTRSLVDQRSLRTPLYEEEDQRAPLAWLRTPILQLWSPFSKLDEVYYIRQLNRVMAMVSSSLNSSPERQPEILASDSPRYAILTRHLFPIVERLPHYFIDVEVLRRQQEVALALACYRTQNKRYPQSLQQAANFWGKTFLPDPYSQQPFLYRSNGHQYLLYSVGPNRRDDDGHGILGIIQLNRPANQDNDDITWGKKFIQGG